MDVFVYYLLASMWRVGDILSLLVVHVLVGAGSIRRVLDLDLRVVVLDLVGRLPTSRRA